MGRDDNGCLPLIAFGTLSLFYFVWAAMHDLAHGDEGTLERTVLAICAAAFPLLYWLALRTLTSNGRLAWLAGTGLLIGLFTSGAVSALLHPKYPADPMLASAFLAAGLPALGIIGYHLVREVIHRRVRPGS